VGPRFKKLRSSGFEPDLNAAGAKIALGCGPGIGVNIKGVVGAGLHAGLAADALASLALFLTVVAHLKSDATIGGSIRTVLHSRRPACIHPLGEFFVKRFINQATFQNDNLLPKGVRDDLVGFNSRVKAHEPGVILCFLVAAQNLLPDTFTLYARTNAALDRPPRHLIDIKEL
jgi:hypothetical protein